MASSEQTPFRAGFVAIVGRPNVGKSTLLNRILGEHVAIVSPRPQTTRTRILGVFTGPRAQLALFDTPGLHRAKGALNRRMVEVALETLGEVDAILFLVEAGHRAGGARRGGRGDALGDRGGGAERQARHPRDLQDGPGAPAALLPVIEAYRALHAWAEIVPFSGLTGENVDVLLEALARHVPEADAPLFPPDVLTDQAERQIAAEYVREQVMLQTRQEIPYAAAVEVEEFDESGRRDDGGLVRISAVIWVERESQKAIVIGKQGRDAEEHRDARPREPRAPPRLQGVPRAHREGGGALERARLRPEAARDLRIRS